MSVMMIIALAVLALLAAPPAAAISCSTTDELKSWPCNVCEGATAPDECRKCITGDTTNPATDPWKCQICKAEKADSQCWACVKKTPDASACSTCSLASTQDKTACYTCLLSKETTATFVPAWECATCHRIATKATRDACYTCATSTVPGWYCRSLGQTAGCVADAPTNALTGVNCLGCMVTAGDNNVNACLSCGGLATSADKQKCLTCVTNAKNANGLAYSCATTLVLRQCIAELGAGYTQDCANCYYQQGLRDRTNLKTCAYCSFNKRGPNCVKMVTWGVRDVEPQTLKANVNDLIAFNYITPGNSHNVYDVTTVQVTGGCPSATTLATLKPVVDTMSASPPTVMEYKVSTAGTFNYICGIGISTSSQGHCESMKLTVDVVAPSAP